MSCEQGSNWLHRTSSLSAVTLAERRLPIMRVLLWLVEPALHGIEITLLRISKKKGGVQGKYVYARNEDPKTA